jgi:hypothetical protein
VKGPGPDQLVLQQAPAKACVYGLLGPGGTAATVKISSSAAASASDFAPFEVDAEVTAGGHWKACLTPQKVGGDYTITAVRSQQLPFSAIICCLLVFSFSFIICRFGVIFGQSWRRPARAAHMPRLQRALSTSRLAMFGTAPARVIWHCRWCTRPYSGEHVPSKSFSLP